MSSQEIQSNNEREDCFLKEQARAANWSEEDIEAAFGKDQRPSDAPWTKVQSRKRARAATGSKMRALDLGDEGDGELQRAIAASLGVAHDEAGTSAAAAAPVVDLTGGDESEEGNDSSRVNGKSPARTARQTKPGPKVPVVKLSSDENTSSDDDSNAAQTQQGQAADAAQATTAQLNAEQLMAIQSLLVAAGLQPRRWLAQLAQARRSLRRNGSSAHMRWTAHWRRCGKGRKK